MNTVVLGYLGATNDFQENHVFRHKTRPDLEEFYIHSNGSSSPVDESCSYGAISKEFLFPRNASSPVDDESSSSSSSEGESFKEADHSDAILKFISQMLMEEEDLEIKPCMLRDCLALQATEKSLYDVLNNNFDQHVESPNDHFTKTFSINSNGSSASFIESHSNIMKDYESSSISPENQCASLHTLHPDFVSFDSSMTRFWVESESKLETNFNSEFLGHYSQPKNNTSDYRDLVDRNKRVDSTGNSREKKNRYREDSDSLQDYRSNKQLANNVGESEPLDMYDKVLLCSNSELLMLCSEGEESEAKKKWPHLQQVKGSNRGRPRGGGGKKQGIVKEVVDLRSLLMQCAQALSSNENRTVNDLLMRIRQHSSPQGDGTERLAHYFANALEARLAGTGTASYIAFYSIKISAAEVLKAYQTYIRACPFKKMSNVLANKTIKKLASGATTLHIIDFGILYGYQWPCLIQALSERPGGPPKLRITGIDFPQPGFRPAERVEASGRRLANYCERFRVPFEYNAIAQKWETIKLEDLKIEKNEFLVVNSLYRLHNVPDETVIVNSPRDAVLDLIKRINPDIFIHGIVNGTYNTPFFITRFREALFHFSSMFDMFEATIPREDQNRLRFEEEVLGKDAMNIIACEGTERVDRPETYKQWQARNVRAGFKQVPLDQEIVKYVRSKVKMNYHKDFSVDEDGKWMLQGWKGRVIHAISYWQSTHK